MVDLSKYPKIYEWDETYGQLCSIHSIAQCAVYVLRIGENLYVGESNFCRREILKHVMDMRLGIHVNPKMNEAYKKAKNCQAYILRSIQLFDHAVNIKNNYIKSLNADLNISDEYFKVNCDLWMPEEDFFKKWAELIGKLKVLEKEYEVPLNHFVCASISNFLDTFTYQNKDLLVNEGITYLDILYRKVIEKE